MSENDQDFKSDLTEKLRARKREQRMNEVQERVETLEETLRKLLPVDEPDREQIIEL